MCDGSKFGMLRNFELNVRIGPNTLLEHTDEPVHIAVAPHAQESACRVLNCRAHPAQEHMAIAPALHVARVMGDQAIEVLDWIGGSQRPIERPVDAKAADGECFIEPFLKARSCARMDSFQRMRQPLELSLCKQCIAGYPGVAKRPADARIQFLRQLLEHVGTRVLRLVKNQHGAPALCIRAQQVG